MQRVVVCCSGRIVLCCGVLQCDAVCCSVLQRVAVSRCVAVSQCVAVFYNVLLLQCAVMRLTEIGHFFPSDTPKHMICMCNIAHPYV